MPVKSGSRFSRKAVTASMLAGVPTSLMNAASSVARATRTSADRAWSMARLVATSDGIGHRAKVAATSSASSSSCSGSHTFHATPSSTASSADTQAPLNSTHEARCHPICCGNSRLLAASGATPSGQNGARKRAVLDTSARSQWARIVNPMPTPRPLTAAISGLSNVSRASSSAGKPLMLWPAEVSPASTWSLSTPSPAISPRSCPAEKARPVAVSTTTATPGSAAASRSPPASAS